ncbi:transglutaminase domain-containing protein [Candidatus Pacearchaeota archaeon]|nr:transglutaminase domain-containing protein [Candidatus Pacearchaeota archaeon]
MIEDLTFLEEGKFTQHDRIVKNLAEKLQEKAKRENITIRRVLSQYISREFTSQKGYTATSPDFRNRTASQIIKSKEIMGCTDIALIFLAVARAAGIPSRYVETLQKSWLTDKTIPGVRGHIFVDIQQNGIWKVYEPLTGFCRQNDYIFLGREYQVIGKGIDFSQVYEFKNGIFQPEPSDFTDIINIAQRVREETQ